MGLRNPQSGFTIQHVLRGRTLRDIVDAGTTLKLMCDACTRDVVLPPADAAAAFAALLDREIEALAARLACRSCGARDGFLTIVPRT